jgi:hypothetical protein
LADLIDELARAAHLELGIPWEPGLDRDERGQMRRFERLSTMRGRAVATVGPVRHGECVHLAVGTVGESGMSVPWLAEVFGVSVEVFPFAHHHTVGPQSLGEPFIVAVPDRLWERFRAAAHRDHPILLPALTQIPDAQWVAIPREDGP